MRVALVCHGLPPERRTGVETHAAALARALAGLGHDVVAIAPERSPDRPHLAVREVAPSKRGGERQLRINVVHAPRSTAERDQPPGLQAVFKGLWERERPDVVHVENAFGLGLEPFTSAEAAGLPCVASAHDFAPVCHRVTLLRPDLERCVTVGDPALCGRCDAGTAVLDACTELGDYQLGAFPDQLERDQRAALALALTNDDELRTAERRAFARARRAAWNSCVRILVPSRYLLERCLEGGLDAARMQPFEFGVELSQLTELAAPERAPDEPLRVLFVGGLSKHKGAHLLMDAVERAECAIELTIAGSSTDEPYRTELARRAAGSVRLSGAFDRSELARLLAGAHVVAVPSLWAENAPFVIREAFAARRPVLTNRLGALPESVRDGRDGLLIEPTPDAWSRTLDELARDPGQLERWVQEIRPPRSIESEAQELVELYTELVEAAGTEDRLPASVQPFVRALEQLDDGSEGEVVRRSLAAIDRARKQDGVSDENFTALAASVVIVELGQLSGELRAAVREIEWLRGTLEQSDERDRWRVGVEQDLRAELAALRAELEHERARAASQARELDWWRERAEAAEAQVRELEAARDAAQAEVDWRKSEVAGLAAERDWLRSTLSAIGEERAWLNETLAAARVELDWRRSENADLGAALAALTRHELWLREELRALVRPTASEDEALAVDDLPELFERLAERLGGGESA